MLATVNSHLGWWVARSAGIVAWALVTMSILWGLALSTRIVRQRGLPAWLLDLHRFLGVLSIVFTAIHILGIVGDNWTHFGWTETLVPTKSTWRPHAITWGIVSLYLLIAIQLTSWAMRWLPRRVWHTIHLASFLVFIASTTHAALAGADRGNLLVQWSALVATMVVLFFVMFRLLVPRGSASRRPDAVRAPIAQSVRNTV